MLIALWILTLFVLGAWSLTAWGLHAVLTLDAARVDDLKPLIDQIPHAALIEVWIPGWQDLLRATVDLAQGVIGWVGGAAPVIVWVLWGLGTLVIVGVALLLTLVVRLMTRRSGPAAAAPV